MRMPRSRAARVVAGALLALVLASGCTPTPEPTPTPTGFANEEEAFRAAEETYRAYVDALNEVDLADPATFEPVYAWTTGDAQGTDKKSLSTRHAKGWSMSGESRVSGMHKGDVSRDQVTAIACVDVTDVVVLDADGVSQVNPDRLDTFALQVDFSYSNSSPTRLLVSKSRAADESPCA